MGRLVLILLLMLAAPLATPLGADERIVLGLSKDHVDITTNFNGSEILIFGAVGREAPAPDGPPLEVIVTVAGPSQPVTVRRKANRFGIWVNTAEVEVDAAPAFYAVATSAPLTEALLDTEDLRHKITIPRAIRSVGAPSEVGDAAPFSEALIRIRTASDQFQLREGAVSLDEETLFRTAIRLPAALVEGGYKARIFLTRGGAVVAQSETTIDVYKVGLEQILYSMSREQPLIYGLMSLAIAIFAGWSASAVFTALRRG